MNKTDQKKWNAVLSKQARPGPHPRKTNPAAPPVRQPQRSKRKTR